MKKQLLTITTLAFGALVLITNCKKKEDNPAPATTTTTGTTTTGTTTSGTTTSGTTSGTTTTGTTTTGTTTSGTTTSGSTTSGTTTSSTTSGSTTASTTSGTTTTSTTTSGSTTASTTSGTTAGSTTGTAGTTIGGSGTFTVDGANNIPQIMIKSATSGVTSTITQNGNYSLQLMFGGESFAAGNYSIISVLSGLPSGSQVRITVVNVGTSVQYWSESTTSGTVTVSGKTVTFSNITLKQYNGTSTITISGNYTFN